MLKKPSPPLPWVNVSKFCAIETTDFNVFELLTKVYKKEKFKLIDILSLKALPRL